MATRLRSWSRSRSLLGAAALVLWPCFITGSPSAPPPAAGAPVAESSASSAAALPVSPGATPRAGITVPLGGAPAPTGGSADTLFIFFTAETRGNLVPCSCPTRPLGGLARRAGFLEAATERLRPSGTILRLDSGGFLPVGEVPLRDDPGVANRLVGLLLESFETTGTDAVALNFAERDFLRNSAPRPAERLGRTFLLTDRPGAPRLLPWGDATVAVVALEETLSDSVVVAVSRRARDRADLLIVLARADAVTGRRLARLTRADLVILSYGARPTTALVEGPSHLVGCGSQGKEIGEVAFARTAGGPQFVRYRLHPMDPGTPEDPRLAEEVRQLLDEEGPGWIARVSPTQ